MAEATRPLTDAERNRVSVMRDDTARVWIEQRQAAREYLPTLVAVVAIGLTFAGLAGRFGGAWWCALPLALPIVGLAGWIAWVLVDDYLNAETRAAEAVREANTDLANGVVEVQVVQLDGAWALHDAEGTLLAAAIPRFEGEEALLVRLSGDHLPVSIELFTLPVTRWRWTNESPEVRDDARRFEVSETSLPPEAVAVLIAWSDVPEVHDWRALP